MIWIKKNWKYNERDAGKGAGMKRVSAEHTGSMGISGCRGCCMHFVMAFPFSYSCQHVELSGGRPCGRDTAGGSHAGSSEGYPGAEIHQAEAIPSAGRCQPFPRPPRGSPGQSPAALHEPRGAGGHHALPLRERHPGHGRLLLQLLRLLSPHQWASGAAGGAGASRCRPRWIGWLTPGISARWLVSAVPKSNGYNEQCVSLQMLALIALIPELGTAQLGKAGKNGEIIFF